MYGSVTVLNGLNGCWRPICLVLGTVALCDALVRIAMYKSFYLLTYERLTVYSIVMMWAVEHGLAIQEKTWLRLLLAAGRTTIVWGRHLHAWTGLCKYLVLSIVPYITFHMYICFYKLIKFKYFVSCSDCGHVMKSYKLLFCNNNNYYYCHHYNY